MPAVRADAKLYGALPNGDASHAEQSASRAGPTSPLRRASPRRPSASPCASRAAVWHSGARVDALHAAHVCSKDRYTSEASKEAIVTSPRDAVSVDVKERLGKWRSAEEGKPLEERPVTRQAVDVPAPTDVKLSERLQRWKGAEDGDAVSAPARKEPITIAEGEPSAPVLAVNALDAIPARLADRVGAYTANTQAQAAEKKTPTDLPAATVRRIPVIAYDVL